MADIRRPTCGRCKYWHFTIRGKDFVLGWCKSDREHLAMKNKNDICYRFEDKMDIKATVLAINDLRRKNKDRWYYYFDNELGIELKGFNTWLQKLDIKGVDYASPMGMKVKDFKEYLYDALETALNGKVTYRFAPHH